MKKLLLAAALFVAAPAYAGDLPRYNNAPQVYRNIFNWTGFYAGLHGGWGWGDSTGSSLDGYALGGQIGYNYQLVSGLTFGAETDITFSGIDGAAAGGIFTADYIGTLRGRLGYAFDRVLIYGTAGLAYAGGDLQVGALSNGQTHFGYAIGFGIEGMITNNLSARLEYIYTDFGSRTYQTTGGPVGVGFDASQLRAGINYRF
ncbi:MAG: porin family protein [Rhizobiales bacterium]|nr:porin family protein [Hyphomicrobiales bacterium]